jgi:hypothetical protein
LGKREALKFNNKGDHKDDSTDFSDALQQIRFEGMQHLTAFPNKETKATSTSKEPAQNDRQSIETHSTQ